MYAWAVCGHAAWAGALTCPAAAPAVAVQWPDLALRSTAWCMSSVMGLIDAQTERKGFFVLTFGAKIAYCAAFVFIRADEYHKTLTDVLRKVSVSNVGMISILRGSFDIILPCVLDGAGRCKLPPQISGDMEKLEKILGCHVAGANLKDLLAGEEDRADFSAYVRNVVRQADSPQAFSEATLTTGGVWSCGASMPPIAQVLHSKMKAKGPQMNATLHLSVVPRSAVSMGKERHLVAAIQFSATVPEDKEADLGTGFESFKHDDAYASTGGSTHPPTDSGSSGIVANLADLNKLGASALLHGSVEASDTGSMYWGPSMVSDETMSHLGAFMEKRLGKAGGLRCSHRGSFGRAPQSKALGALQPAHRVPETTATSEHHRMGQTLEGRFRMNCSTEPYQLDIEVLPKGSSCPPPAIPYIFKFQDGRLHLCGPADGRMHRPSNFDGPGLCVMDRAGGLTTMPTMPKSDRRDRLETRSVRSAGVFEPDPEFSRNSTEDGPMMPCQEPPQKPAQIAQIAEKPAQKLSGVVKWVEEKLGSPRRFGEAMQWAASAALSLTSVNPSHAQGIVEGLSSTVSASCQFQAPFQQAKHVSQSRSAGALLLLASDIKLPLWIFATLLTWAVCWFAVAPVYCQDEPTCAKQLKTYPRYYHLVSTAALIAMCGHEVMGLIATYMGAQQTQALIPHLKSRCLPSFLLALMFGVLATAERGFSRSEWTVAHVMPSAVASIQLCSTRRGINVPILSSCQAQPWPAHLLEISRPLVVTNIYVIFCWAATATDSGLLEVAADRGVIRHVRLGLCGHAGLGQASSSYGARDLPSQQHPYMSSVMGLIDAQTELKGFFVLTFGAKIAYCAAFVFIRMTSTTRPDRRGWRKVSVSNVGMISILSSGDMEKLEKILGRHAVAADSPQAFSEATLTTGGGKWSCGASMPPISGHSRQSMGKERHLVAAIQFSATVPRGAWEGTFSRALGAYSQRIEFQNDCIHASITVMAHLEGRFQMNCSTEPYQLDIEVLTAACTLCGPADGRMHRPSNFDGPAFAPRSGSAAPASRAGPEFSRNSTEEKPAVAAPAALALLTSVILALRKSSVSTVYCQDEPTCAKQLKTYPRYYHLVMGLIATYMGAQQTQALIPHLKSRCLPSFLLALMFGTVAHVMPSADGLTAAGVASIHHGMEWGINVPILFILSGYCSLGRPISSGSWKWLLIAAKIAYCAAFVFIQRLYHKTLDRRAVGCHVAGANLKDLLAGEEDRADFSAYVRNVVLHSKMKAKGPQMNATLHLSVVPRFGREHGKGAAPGGGHPVLGDDHGASPAGTRVFSGIVANLADLNKLGASALLHGSVEASDTGSMYWGPSMVSDETMSHLGAFMEKAALGTVALDAQTGSLGGNKQGPGRVQPRIELRGTTASMRASPAMGQTLVLAGGQQLPAPAIPYIFKFQDGRLHLCGPADGRMHRPSNFDGPGLCVMDRAGGLTTMPTMPKSDRRDRLETRSVRSAGVFEPDPEFSRNSTEDGPSGGRATYGDETPACASLCRVMPCQEPPQKPAQIAQIAEKPAQKLSGVVNWVEEKLGSPRCFVWDGGGACYRLAALNLAVLNLACGAQEKPAVAASALALTSVILALRKSLWSGNVPFFRLHPRPQRS
ncbi:unnamed protein product [Effrenium voratum]|uniref:Uncharacterized protein n=1 Tax=Effrenium voratum TaxID=2562239 RepID=A0AA36JFU3_9DINO|nr:unnamed protein product [Effrenium voratum]